jgi:hypothetical protein
MHAWTLWYRKAASTGLLFARARVDATDEVLVHAAPEYLTVEVESDTPDLAFARDLKRTQESPMTRLRRVGGEIFREDVWPTDADLGRTVFFPAKRQRSSKPGGTPKTARNGAGRSSCTTRSGDRSGPIRP